MSRDEQAVPAASAPREVSPAPLDGALHAVRSGRPEAAAAVWSWRAGPGIGAPPRPAAIRVRGAVKALVAGAIGSLVHLRVSRWGGALVVAVSGLMLIAALASPTGVYTAMERGLGALAGRAGRLLSWVVLPAVFYGVFAPCGRALRRGRRDRLQRFRDAARSSYWSDRTGERVASADRRRQY